MKLFERYRDEGSVDYAEKPDNSVYGTPLGEGGEEFRDFMQDVDGFEPDADAYVYVLVLRRSTDDTRWYYVGEAGKDRENPVEKLKERIDTHQDVEMAKPVRKNGMGVGDKHLLDEPNDSYAVIGIERVEPISVSDELLDARVMERERSLAYEIAIEKDTTRVLGGK